MEYSKEWAEIVELQQHTKNLILIAEEYDLNWNDYLQPFLEQRSALDHICRTMAVKTGINKDGSDGEAYENLNKAKGHLYRAFFDTADWLSTRFRSLIIEEGSSYNSDCIKKAIPNYYSDIPPDIQKINTKIADIRNNKDIASQTGTINQVNEYNNLIDKLRGYYEIIIEAKESLEELKNEQRRKSWKSIIIQIVVGLLIAVVGTIVGAVFL